jgi:hypothetical protein
MAITEKAGTRLRQDMIDYARWAEVDLVIEQRKCCRREIAELRALPKTPRELPQKREKLLKGMEIRLKRLGHTWDRAYECASENLKKTRAFGGRDAMETSYRKVKKRFDDPAQAMRYHQLDPRFLRKLGLKP